MKTGAELKSHPLLANAPYEAYTYAYPHKTAYRELSPAVPLEQVWRQEARDALFLYFHVPFCEMRCGFCNLFTTSNPAGSLVQDFLDAVRQQADVTRSALPDAQFARLAFGGGTPTFLSVQELEILLGIAEKTFSIHRGSIPFSVESSPATASCDKLAMLRAHGVDRISLGVQSFLDAEAANMGRRQKRTEVETALRHVRTVGFPTLNIDLIYGIPGQTTDSWMESLQAALAWKPEELFLYPLYVRPLTGLQKSNRRWEDRRLDLFRVGRDFLLSRGYSQISMRMFRAGDGATNEGPTYCAQDDGMVGLGCGARSYTRSLQYSSRYAVTAAGVQSILGDYAARKSHAFTRADYGFPLDEDEQRRRYVALTLLNKTGVPLDGYRRRFGSDVFADLPQLADLETLGFASRQENRFSLNSVGLERSDSIGPWLYSERVTTLMDSFSLK